MKEIIFLAPVFQEKIWGGNRLCTDFPYTIPSSSTGECWAVSAHPNGDCEIKSGSFQGRKLSWLWEQHRELFGNMAGNSFPLLVKIIDAKEDLSIQVHPDDEYARIHENGGNGKSECWYVLGCEDDSEIIIGHNAENKEELIQMIEQKRWKEFIKSRPVKKGDFFQISPGTVHAIKAGTLILEIQQNSDTTYRLYDYDRLQNGKQRELHLDKSIDVIKCPHLDITSTGKRVNYSGIEVEELISSENYTVKKLIITGEATLEQNTFFQIVSVIEGSGNIDNKPISKGDHFILPFEYGMYKLDGTMQLIVSDCTTAVH